MEKGKIAAVGEQSSILVFHAAGVDTIPVSGPGEAESAVVKLAGDGYKLIFLSEVFAGQLTDTLLKYRGQTYPVIVPVPDRNGTTGFSMRNITANMEKAIGTNIFEES